jgi:hypothetical protein
MSFRERAEEAVFRGVAWGDNPILRGPRSLPVLV